MMREKISGLGPTISLIGRVRKSYARASPADRHAANKPEIV
jgi:hypothetical protein